MPASKSSRTSVSPMPASAAAAQQQSRVQVHELAAENATLKARLQATLEELKTTKEICLRNYKPRRVNSGGVAGGRGGGGGDNSSASSTFMSFALYADVASQTRQREAPVDCGVQTVACDTFETSEEVRRLKAEVLRSHAEVASLQHALNVVRHTAGSSSAPHSPAPSPTQQHAASPARISSTPEDAELAHDITMNRIAMLTEALRAANETIAQREREVQQLRVAAAPDAAGTVAAGDTPKAAVVHIHKGTATDDPVLDLDVPLSPRDREAVSGRSEHAAALQSALAVTKAQLRQALEELAESRASSGPAAAELFMSPPRARRAGSGGTTADVGVNVDTLYPYERLFRLYRRPFTPEGVEALLKEVEVSQQQLVAARSNSALQQQLASVAGRDVGRNALGGSGVAAELDDARRELIEAHEKIDELEFALELERKERARHATVGGAASGDGGKQAAAEIAFLCDTLAATRAEMERLTARLDSAELERDAAVASFHDLRERSEDMLRGCREITESARSDADTSIHQLALTSRQQSHEVNVLRGELAAASRQLEDTRKRRDTAEREAAGAKQKLLHLRESMARLREEYNAQSVALRDARAALTSTAASGIRAGSPQLVFAPPTPIIRASSARSASADPTSLQALDAALGRSGANASPAAATLRTPSRSSSPPTSSQQPPRDQPPAPPLRSVSAAPSGGGAPSPAPKRSVVASAGNLNYREEYEELKACFLLLAPMVPGAVTAREVTQGICAGLEKLNERIKAFEVEVRKRTTQAQMLRKDLTTAQEHIAALERKTAHVAVIEKKLEHKEKQAEKARRMLSSTKTEAERSLHEIAFEKESLAVELERTKEALALARRELAEGRELMMSLIQES